MLGNNDVVTDYILYGVMYASAITCNKYVLTSLEFQYPTLFQSWQTIVGIVLMWIFSDISFWGITPKDVFLWMPAIALYIGTIYSGSVSLSQLPVPIFLICQSCSDVILLLCNDSMPSGLILLSIPVKLSACMIVMFPVQSKPSYSFTWVIIHVLLSGTYRTVSFWYNSSNGPVSTLSRTQRLFLNYLFSTLILLPMAYIFGHHEKAWLKFRYFTAFKFYIGCICSGVLGWAVNRRWNKLSSKLSAGSKLLMMHLFAKILTILFTMNAFSVQQDIQMWLAILACIIGDLMHIIGTILDKDDLNDASISDEMHDVLVGS